MAGSRADLTIGRPCQTTSFCSAGRLHLPGKEDPPGHHAGVKLARVTAWRSPADLFNSRGRKRPVLDGPLSLIYFSVSRESGYFRSKVATVNVVLPIVAFTVYVPTPDSELVARLYMYLQSTIR
jgi:hypothetical protein